MKGFSYQDMSEMAYGVATIFLVFGVIFLSMVLVAPLFGGIFLPEGLLGYGSWIVLALAGRRASKHGRKGLRMRTSDFAFLSVANTLFFVICFRYPLNIILSILVVVVIAISYRAQGKAIVQESKREGTF